MVCHGGSKKKSFKYFLPVVGDVCRACWIQCAGYPNANSGRVRQAEAAIRRGNSIPVAYKPGRNLSNRSLFARTFISDYILKHSQYSPADTILYVEFRGRRAVSGRRALHDRYVKESAIYKPLKKEAFYREWNRVVAGGVVDPETSILYQVRVRKKHAKGFAKCNQCELWKNRIAGTGDVSKRAGFRRKLDEHVSEVQYDREELARVIRLCLRDRKHAGFYCDAADSAKFQVPTTASTASKLSTLWRVRQKLTCVQMFDVNKSLYMFRTLPDVPTGGNLTGTIFIHLLNLVNFTRVTDIHINVDGAGDNINYTFMYTLAHVLLHAPKQGWALERIHIYRFKVGHTHNDLDATFGVLSRDVYGKRARGDAKKDIFSFTHFQQVNV